MNVNGNSRGTSRLLSYMNPSRLLSYTDSVSCLFNLEPERSGRRHQSHRLLDDRELQVVEVGDRIGLGPDADLAGPGERGVFHDVEHRPIEDHLELAPLHVYGEGAPGARSDHGLLAVRSALALEREIGAASA